MVRRIQAWMAAVTAGCEYTPVELTLGEKGRHHMLQDEDRQRARRSFGFWHDCRPPVPSDELRAPWWHPAGNHWIRGHLNEALLQQPSGVPLEWTFRRDHAIELLGLRARLGHVETPSLDRLHATPDAVQIAVHIRRGDLIHDDDTSIARILPDSYYEEELLKITRFLRQAVRTLHIHIYSDEACESK